MRVLIRRAVLIGLLWVAVACRDTHAPSAECPTRAAAPTPQPIGAYRLYVDGSRSMAPFLAPTGAEDFVTGYEEMLFRLFTRLDPQDSAETWLFGDTLVHLPNAPEARQRLVTRSTYVREQSRLEFAFRHARLYLDSLAALRRDSAGKPARPGRAGVAILVTDGLQSGSGRQLHILAEFDRMIRDHVARGGSFAFIAGRAATYPARSTGAARPEEAMPVLAFLFASGAARDDLERLAHELSRGLDARSRGGDGQFFVLPVRGASAVRLRPRTGIRQVLSTAGDPPVFTFETGAEAVELLADAELGTATRANLPALSIQIERCARGTWEPAGDPSGWSAAPARADSAGTGVHLTLRRANAASVRSGLFRVRLEGSPVPPWVTEFGAGRAESENDIGRFFGGLRSLAGTDAASFGTFYLRVRSD